MTSSRIKIAVVVLVAACIWWSLNALRFDLTQLTPQRLRMFVMSFGVWAPLVYISAYGQPMVPLPASVMTMTGGLAFGPVWGTFAALAGAMIRACSEFIVARVMGREAVDRMLRGRIAVLDQRLGEQGFEAVLVARLVPGIPFNIQNYVFGLSRVRFGSYALASSLGIIPGTLLLAHVGSALGGPAPGWSIFWAVALLIGMVAARHVVRRTRCDR